MQPNHQENQLEQYTEKAFALYFVDDIRYPYISITLVSLFAAWLMFEKVATVVIVAWLAANFLANALREVFVQSMKPKLALGTGHRLILKVFGFCSLVSGLIWAAFVFLYFDAADPMTVLIVGWYVAGQVGGAVTPLSIYLPAFYLFALPVVLSMSWALAATGQPNYLGLLALTSLFLISVINYARVTNRLHRESMRLRFENQNLVADLEHRKDEAENASRNKSLFLAGVSHDLKQPIRAIAMYTGFLRHSAMQNTASDVVVETAEKIESAVGAIHRQISRLLDLSRLESGSMPVLMEWVDLDDLQATVRELTIGEAQSRSVQLRFALGRQRRVWADRRMLESIVLNFVSNAIKHAQGGRVYVGTRLRTGYPRDQQICIEVRDNGSGIAAHQLPLLFDAYQSFDDRTASESHGLGLALAKSQAAYLSCEIDVRSEPHRGSTFTLCGLRSAAPTDKLSVLNLPEPQRKLPASDASEIIAVQSAR